MHWKLYFKGTSEVVFSTFESSIFSSYKIKGCLLFIKVVVAQSGLYWELNRTQGYFTSSYMIRWLTESILWS